MKKWVSLSVLVLFIFFVVVLMVRSSSNVKDTLQANVHFQEYVPHELLVKLKEESVGDIVQSRWLIRDVFNQVQGKIKTYLNEEKDAFDWDPSVFAHRSFHADPYLFHIRVPEGIDLDYAIARLKLNPHVEYVEKNGIARVLTDDTYFGQQWNLYNSLHNGCDIQAQDAWTISTGNSDIVVAVLDSGIDNNHEDLQANLWTNPNEILDGQDNDDNGFVDDLTGWNFVSNSANTNDDYTHRPVAGVCTYNPYYHGTHLAGIIGAAANNNRGISGVCWDVSLMALKIFDYCGATADDRIINAIDYATKNGAFLTSNSYGGGAYSTSKKAAITRAQNRNRLFIAAAGNDYGNDNDQVPVYPASYDNGNIISVLATTNEDGIPNFSNFGQHSVDIGAPGVTIFSTKPAGYQNMSGTSQAVPHVAGVAALALGVCPGLTYGRVKDLILNGADDIDALNNKCVSDGRLNAYNVLNSLGGATSPSAASNLIAYQIAWHIIQLRWNDNSNNELGFEIQRKDQYRTAFIHENCADMNSTSLVYYQDFIDTSEPRSYYTYRVRAANKAGIAAFSNTYEVQIPQTVPAAPTDLNGQSPVLEYAVNIYWTNHAVNALYNYLERRIPGQTDWEEIATLGYNAGSYMDDDAQAGRTYEYRIRAGNPIGYSSYSNILSIEVIQW